jgi:hypothetical protein
MVRLCVPMPVSGRTEIGVDSCIATLVQALNNGGVETTASCCGHGRGDGRIDLADGRVLVIIGRISRDAGRGVDQPSDGAAP